MDYILACSILKIDKQGMYRSLAPVLLLPAMYLMLICFIFLKLNACPWKRKRGSSSGNESSGRVRNYPNYLWSQQLGWKYNFAAEMRVVDRVLSIKPV